MVLNNFLLKKNLYKYITENWDKYKATITEISKNDKNVPLVTIDKYVYNFDAVKDYIYQIPHKRPNSMDGLFYCKNRFVFLEFKGGYKQKRTEENWTQRICDVSGDECVSYTFGRSQFLNLQKARIKELNANVCQKLVMTYNILAWDILPQCEEQDDKISLNAWIVVDSEAADAILGINADLAGKEVEVDRTNMDNIASLKAAIKRFENVKTNDGHERYYERIEVISTVDFEKRMNSFKDIYRRV